MVDAAPGERPAPNHPPRGHEASLHRAVRPDRILRVVRAGGVETALTAEVRRQDQPVDAKEREQGQARGRADRPRQVAEEGHGRATRASWRSWVISATRSCVFAPRMAALATQVTSYPARRAGSIPSHAARSTRLARLRFTALPTLRPATKAA